MIEGSGFGSVPFPNGSPSTVSKNFRIIRMLVSLLDILAHFGRLLVLLTRRIACRFLLFSAFGVKNYQRTVGYGTCYVRIICHQIIRKICYPGTGIYIFIDSSSKKPQSLLTVLFPSAAIDQSLQLFFLLFCASSMTNEYHANWSITCGSFL